jgi:hypothetical protein
VLTGKRVLASLPHTGRASRVVLVEPDIGAEQEEPAQRPERKLSQPKLVDDRVLEWASGE